MLTIYANPRACTLSILQSFHILIWAATMTAAGIEYGTFILIIIQAAVGVALVIYIPGAIALTSATVEVSVRSGWRRGRVLGRPTSAIIR